MVKMNALAAVVALSALAAACSGGGSEPSEPVTEEAAAPEEVPAEEATTEEAPVEETAATGGDMVTKDGIAYASLTGDAAAGNRVFAQCRTCHVTDPGVNRVGPALADIIGRKAGSVSGFNYSPANKDSGITWTEEQMYVYLEDPQRTIPKTKMIFGSGRNVENRSKA